MADEKASDSSATATSSPAAAGAESSKAPPSLVISGAEAAGAPTAAKPVRVGGRRKKKVEVLEIKIEHWSTILWKRIKVFYEVKFLAVIRELFSRDQATRKMTFFLILNITGFIILLSTVFYNCGTSKIMEFWNQSQLSAREKKELLHHQRELADAEASWLKMDKFIFDLNSGYVDHKGVHPHMAEFDISIQGDSPETKVFMEENEVQVRNAVYKSLIGWDRETLMSSDGKKKLRQSITDSINNYLPQGKILDAYFLKFLFK